MGEARKANFTLQRNLCKNAKMLLLGCVGLRWLGTSQDSGCPGEVVRRPEEPQSSPTVDLELWARRGKAISTVQRNLCKNAKMLLLGCVALGWLGRPPESSWPGEVGRRLGDAQSSPTVDRALGEARKANFTLQRNSRPSEKERVLRLLAEGPGASRQDQPRTDDDISRRSGALRGTGLFSV